METATKAAASQSHQERLLAMCRPRRLPAVDGSLAFFPLSLISCSTSLHIFSIDDLFYALILPMPGVGCNKQTLPLHFSRTPNSFVKNALLMLY